MDGDEQRNGDADSDDQVGVLSAALQTNGSPIMGLANKCLDLSSTTDRTPSGNRRVILNTCNGAGTQNWTKSWNGQIVNVGTGLCLNAEGGGTGNGTLLIGFPCQPAAQPNEKWFYTPASTNLELIKNTASGRCVNVPAANSADGTGVILWDCFAVSNDSWAVRIGAPIVGLGGKCLDVDTKNRSSLGNARAVLNTCNGAAQQDWSLNAKNQLVNRDMAGMCLNVEGGGSANGTAMVVFPCQTTAQPNETWANSAASSTSNRSFQLINTGSGKCLNVPAANKADGTGLILWPCVSGGVPNDTWSMLSTPKQTIKVVVIASSNDDGSNQTTTTLQQFRSVLQAVNGLYERAAIEFTIDDGDFQTAHSTLLNTIVFQPPNPTPAQQATWQQQDQVARNLATIFAGKLVVILSAALTGGFSTYTASNDYVALGNAPSLAPLTVAHEFGHYFSCGHPFPDAVAANNLTQAYSLVSNYYTTHGSTLDAFDADGFTDTPPDPGAWVYQERDAPGTNQCAGSDGILVPLTGGGSITFNPDRQNFVSYFNCGPNSQSAASTPRSESITAQQIGAMQNAIGTGFRIQLVRD